MPRGWTTDSQLEFLTDLIPDFEAAREEGRVADWIAPIKQQWFDRWPRGKPTLTELHDADGNIEVAEELAQRREEQVSITIL